MKTLLLTDEEEQKLKERGIMDLIKPKLLALRRDKFKAKKKVKKEKKVPNVGYAAKYGSNVSPNL
jgi:hypothetical protein